MTKTEISEAERRKVLIDELDVSEEIVEKLPADEPGSPEFS